MAEPYQSDPVYLMLGEMANIVRQSNFEGVYSSLKQKKTLEYVLRLRADIEESVLGFETNDSFKGRIAKTIDDKTGEPDLLKTARNILHEWHFAKTKSFKRPISDVSKGFVD